MEFGCLFVTLPTRHRSTHRGALGWTRHPQVRAHALPSKLQRHSAEDGTNRQMVCKGSGGPVEPETVVKAKGSEYFWLQASSHEIAAGPN